MIYGAIQDHRKTYPADVREKQPARNFVELRKGKHGEDNKNPKKRNINQGQSDMVEIEKNKTPAEVEEELDREKP